MSTFDIHEGAYARRSARVLLLDSRDRILLLRFRVDLDDLLMGHMWITPGGRINDGESLHAAALRELHEEIGLTVDPRDLQGPVAYSWGHAELQWINGMLRDDFFYCRIDSHEVDISGLEAIEQAYHTGHRWWSLDELTSSPETVYPLELIALLADLVADRIPAEPRCLPWHH